MCISDSMKDLHLTLFGRKEEIEAILKDMEYEKDRLDIVDAREIVDNNEAPCLLYTSRCV